MLNNQKFAINREFFLIIEEDSTKENILKQKLNDLIQNFNSIDLQSSLISSEEWRNLLYIVLNPCSPLDIFKKSSTGINTSFKSRILPTSLKIAEKSLVLGDAYISIISLRTYPTFVQPGWLGAIANVDKTRMIIDLKRMDSQEISKTLKKSISEVKSKLINVNDYNDQILLNNQLDDYVELVNRIDREHERFSFMSVYFMCYAESEEELDVTKRELKSILASYGIGYNDLMFEQEQALNACLPLINDKPLKNIGLPIPTLTVASSFPFIYQSLQDANDSIPIGADMLGSLLFFNPLERNNKRKNSNAVIVGNSGSGKSTLVKKLIRATWARGTKIIAIDPEREYREMCEQLNGSWIDCGTGLGGTINPLEIRHGEQNDTEEEVNNLSQHIQFFRTFIKYYLKDLNAFELTKIEELLLEVYKEKNIDFNTNLLKLNSEDYPTMQDLYLKVIEELKNAKLNHSSQTTIDSLDKISSLLKRATKGADAKLFNCLSTVNLNKTSDFIVLDIHSLVDSDETILKTQFFNILSWAWNEISRDRNEQVILICDEAHLLIDPANPDGADFLKRCTKRCRKYNAGVWTISQNLIDYTADNLERFGQVIIDNSTYLILLEQGQKEIESVQKMMNLSESEKQFLLTAEKGQGLFIIGKDTRIPIQIHLREEEKKLFGNAGGA